MIQRLPDWPKRLDEFLQENQSRKFQHGEWDCCQLAAQAIEAMCGVQVESFAGEYRTMVQALYLCRRKTGKSNLRMLVEHVMRRNGFEQRAATYAQRGDLVLTWNGRWHLVGVLDLSGMIAVLTDAGMARIPRTRAVTSWAI